MRPAKAGNPRFYLTPFPDREQTLTVSPQGGNSPAWSRDGSRLFYLHPDGRRFLVGVLGEQKSTPPITRLGLVHNWFTELERLSPTGR